MEQDSSIIFRRLTPEEQLETLLLAEKNRNKLIYKEKNDNNSIENYKKLIKKFPQNFTPKWYSNIFELLIQSNKEQINSIKNKDISTLLIFDITRNTTDDMLKDFNDTVNNFKNIDYNAGYHEHVYNNIFKMAFLNVGSLTTCVGFENSKKDLQLLKIIFFSPFKTPLDTKHTFLHEFCHVKQVDNEFLKNFKDKINAEYFELHKEENKTSNVLIEKNNSKYSLLNFIEETQANMYASMCILLEIEILKLNEEEKFWITSELLHNAQADVKYCDFLLLKDLIDNFRNKDFTAKFIKNKNICFNEVFDYTLSEVVKIEAEIEKYIEEKNIIKYEDLLRYNDSYLSKVKKEKIAYENAQTTDIYNKINDEIYKIRKNKDDALPLETVKKMILSRNLSSAISQTGSYITPEIPATVIPLSYK